MTVNLTSASEFVITATNGFGEDLPEPHTPLQLNVDPLPRVTTQGNASTASTK